ncbi:protein of unknown function DUF1816 [Stanieria cyanosphaera PCC 7437]|uniref:DUF1816 domain-containing protein n=1 Tax=Stanieria cyanosphaera (strain ATCC 29371 / PCC 7437) TaxID=111780 RepID=K9XVY1_STAC7|nr:DUF1816 domain-containing protein [Stanieria cyanosphaera]AFZ36246.1 protein of unknown function DUF1816 [Stanieria cyanosphaera PCC 7437]
MLKEILTKVLDSVGKAYWVEITTDTPACIYYFGPFLTAREAQIAQGGYVEDLKGEGAQGISLTIKRCQPSELTIFDELDEPVDFKPVPAFGKSY